MDSFIPSDSCAPSLSPDERDAAVSELHIATPFSRVNRKFVDPQKPGDHKYALFSFVKSKTATADPDGFFGVAKIRGSFYTEDESAARAEELIKDVDSTNSIYTCRIGVPFPLIDRGYADQLTEVDLQNKTESAISDNIRAKRQAEQKEMNEIKARRDALMKDDGNIGPEEEYIEQRVKLAHLRYAIHEHAIKGEECKELEKKVRLHLNQCKDANPEYEANYMEKYMQSRREVGAPKETDEIGFMRFMADPIDPPVSYIS